MKRILIFLFFCISTSIFAQPILTLDSIVVVTSNDTVYVWDYNAWEQCGFLLDYTVDIVDSVITITQIDTADDATTGYCYHNFVVPVVGLLDGEYRIDIYRDCLYEDIKFIKSFWFQYPLSSIDNFEEQTDKFILYNAYPNPFNPNTKIKYSIQNSDMVQIKVYDIMGVEIETLLNEYKQTGTYEVEFDAGNLTSGVYFYRMTSGNYSETKKMILLR